MNAENSSDHRSVVTQLGRLMVWLGGGDWRDIDEASERSAYQATGFVVLLGALVAWGVATSAAVLAGGLSVLFALTVTVLAALVVGALGRVLATAPGRGRTLVGLGLVAGLVGVVLGELAALAIFTGPLTQQLNSQADRAATAVAGGERAGQLARLRADRAALDSSVGEAVARRDSALLVARCEYNPAPGCPAQLITGEPGRGLEAEQARTALAGADADLAAARADRDRRAPELDRAVAAAAERVDRDRNSAEELARSDTGLVARWIAMNDYTGEHPAALIPRLAAIFVLALLVAAPLLLRLWRGTTDQDRLVTARRLRRQAEQDADTSIAVRRAEVRATLELRRQDELLAADAEVVELTAPSVRTALPAASASALPTGAASALPAASASALPAGSVPETAVAVPERVELLDRLPGPLPVIGRSLTGIAGAFVPAPIARMAAGRPRPMRIMRSVLDEVEEFQFTMMRRRKATLTEEHYETEPEPEPRAEQPAPSRRSVLLDRVYRTVDDRGVALPDGLPADALPSEPGPVGLESGRRQLPAAERPS